MISKLLYTYFKHERKHNGGDKIENVHMRKKVTDCNIKQHMNPYENTNFGFATLFKGS